jgi:hypothetical protein
MNIDFLNRIDRHGGGPAFPQVIGDEASGMAIFPGMTLRDYFAARAMMLVDPSSAQAMADNAYKIADAMLKARKTEGGR